MWKFILVVKQTLYMVDNDKIIKVHNYGNFWHVKFDLCTRVSQEFFSVTYSGIKKE
jgi:hypothetical protein